MSTQKIANAWLKLTKTAADFYKLVMENEGARGFNVFFQPGQKSVMLTRSAQVVYVRDD
jgi:hypothetical protein